MTSKIANSYKANLLRFEEINQINRELRELATKRDEVIKRVIRYYNIIFKNISSKRKEVKIPNQKESYLVTKAGLTRKQDWQINSINLTSIPKVEFLKELVFLSKPQNKILFKKVLSKQKYNIFNTFLKKSFLLSINESFEVKTSKDLIDYRLESPLSLKKIVLNYNSLLLYVEQNVIEPRSPYLATPTIQIPIYNITTLEHMSFLEQVSPETKKLLLLSKKNKLKEIDNLNKFIEYLRTKFENLLVLEELYSKPNMK